MFASRIYARSQRLAPKRHCRRYVRGAANSTAAVELHMLLIMQDKSFWESRCGIVHAAYAEST